MPIKWRKEEVGTRYGRKDNACWQSWTDEDGNPIAKYGESGREAAPESVSGESAADMYRKNSSDDGDE